MSDHACHLCRAPGAEPLIEFGRHPIAHRLLRSPDEKEFTHPVTLAFCDRCGHTQLIDPIPPEELYTQYNWLSGWKWNPHAQRVMELLERLPGMGRDSSVVEFGSNDGAFLSGLRDRGYTRLLGIEPAHDAAAAAAAREIETVQAFFTPSLARELRAASGPADLLVAREVLEHVEGLQELAEAMRDLLRPGAHVLIEVPDFGLALREPDFSIVWEEHVNYFTRDTLAQYLATAGIDLVHAENATFSGHTLVAVGRYTGHAAPRDGAPPTGLRAATEMYRDRWPGFRDDLRRWLEEARDAGKRIALYGAGCRSCCLVNYAGLGDYIDLVVDDEPAKQGTYMPGSRLRVAAPAALGEHAPDLVLLAVNAENEDAVVERSGGLAHEFASIHPPSPRLPAFWRDA